MTSEIGYLIQVNDETKEGYHYPVSQDFLIGNSAQCNLKIAEDGISDKHCRIKLVDDEVCIYSLNSQNPIFLNNEPVSEEGKPIKDKDKIRINDSHELEWKTITDRRISSRSLPLENAPSLEVNARYSDSALTAWKNVDPLLEECTKTNILPQNSVDNQKDELANEEESPELLKAEFVEKSNASISREINRSSAERENKIERSGSTPVKSRKSDLPDSPFPVDKHNSSKSFNRNVNDEMDPEYSKKTISEEDFDDSVVQHSTSQKPFHSTPKAASGLKKQKKIRPSSSSFIELNLETTIENNSSKLQTCGDISEKNDELNEKSTRKSTTHDEAKKLSSTSKKNVSTPTKRASESLNESRRNTRGRTSMLRKTFEENSGDNEVKSLTTPEKLTETNITQTLFNNDSEMENITDTIADYKSLNESSKAGFASVSDENDTCEGSFIDKYKMCNVVKNVSVSKPAMAKCARNLSYISPPENNRSQEYMDSMVSTPQKNSPSQRESITENYNVSAVSILSNTKDSSFDESTNTSLSSARKRRSTGFTPFVGTPSNEYRVTRKMSTPFSRSILSRTSVDFDNMGSSRDGKHSSERSSTPFKLPPGKSSIRDSISCQPTIQESVSFEELEANNHEHDSINDSKFQNVTKRRGRRRFGESTFAAEDKILEESELKSDDSELGDCSFEEENTEASNIQTSTFLEGCDDVSTHDKTKTETLRNAELKSILTPCPKNMALKEKSVKRVTFVFPSSAESTAIKEDSTASVDESFAMINSWKPKADIKQHSNSDSVISEEELHVSDRPETDPSCNSLSEQDDSITNSVEEKCDESSLNVTGVEYLTKIQSSLNDLSGVEQIQSPESSPMKCTTEIDDLAETNGKVDSPNDVSERSPINFTEMESSLAFSEPSNRSNIDSNKSIETDNGIRSVKSVSQIASNTNSNDSSTKISCSPGVHLSGVKSLFNTPEKSKLSSIDKKIKCNLNFNLFKDKTEGKDGAKPKSASASKSIVATKQTPVAKSSRLCKSLILSEMTSLNRETPLAKENQIESSDITVEIPENETVARDDCNDDSTATEPFIKTVSATEKRVDEIPEIIVTDATFVDENANNEQMELIENHEEEVVECPSVESSSSAPIENNDEFETSDFEDKLVSGQDEVLSSENDITDDAVSPVLTQIRRSAVLRTLSDSKIISLDDKIQSEEKSFAPISFAENECEEVIESSSSSNAVSAEKLCAALPSGEGNEAAANESQSSSEVVSSDRDNSQISDIASTEYMGDADSTKTSIYESSCNNSQLSDSSTKDSSDLDSMKINMNESSCNVSQLSDSLTKYNNDLDIAKMNPIDDPLDQHLTDLLFAEEPIRAELLENNATVERKIIECLSPKILAQDAISENKQTQDYLESCDPNINVSQSTSSSQELGIRIDASSALINDLHKVLESTPHPSIPSSIEATPIETIKPISFPESSNTSSIEYASSIKPAIFNKPDVLESDNINDGVLTPIKNYVRGSSTPQSTVRRCRKSSRIHRSIASDTVTKLCSPVHDCSIALDGSLTKSDAETVKEPTEIYKEVVAELNTKLVNVREKSDNLQKSPAKEKSPKKVNESAPSTDPISSSLPSSESSNNEDITSANSTNELTANDDQSEHPSENETAENTYPKESFGVPEVTVTTSEAPTAMENVEESQEECTSVPEITVDTSEFPTATEQSEEESSSVPEVTVNTSEGSTVTENIEKSENVSATLVANKEKSSEQPASLSVDAIPDTRRSLRRRKDPSESLVDSSPKRGVVTRNRQKVPSIKTKTKQLKELNESYDDKENVCSLLKVIDKPKKMELSSVQKAVTVPPATEKRSRKSRSLKNVENIATEPESELNEDLSKRSCSIVLPLLDPEIIKSPVKVDDSGNISVVSGHVSLEEEPQIAPKRKRVTRTAKATEQKPAPAVSRTRQKPVKTVTFDVSGDIGLPTVDKVVLSKATVPKRNLRNQASTVEPEVKTRSRRTAANNDDMKPDEKYRVGRTIKIHLEPLNEDIANVAEPIEKKTRSRRGTVAAKNTVKINEETTVKARTQRAAKRAQENVEEDLKELQKRRRTRGNATDEVSTRRNTKSESEDEIVPELSKRTRAKSNMRIAASPPANTVAKSTKTAKNKQLENVNSASISGTKKRTRDVGESSAKNVAEKSNKKTKISKNLEIIIPIESAPVEKPKKRVNIAKEPVASTSKTTPPPRMTRNRKTEVIKEEDPSPVKNSPKETRVTRKKKATEPKSSSTIDVDNSVTSKRVRNSKKSPPAEKATMKRAVVTRSKNISVKKGRISTTLKTSTRSSVASKSASKSSPAKAFENNLPATNQRSTRRRAK